VYPADFGISKHAMSRSGLTSTGQFLGTIDYVAPEQIRGTSVLGLADQYSLGCVLYECLTGRVPFEKDLYAAYTARVTELNTNKFRQNFNDCGAQDTFGEVGWNHLFQHTRSFTVDQMIMGTVRDDQAAGRVFCNYTQGLEYMVWTQNDGHLMGYVAGPVHTDVWNWWVGVHHNIGIGGSPMNMTVPTPSTSGTGGSASMSASPSMSGMSASPSASMGAMAG
jgi:serine/threonine protein kinase